MSQDGFELDQPIRINEVPYVSSNTLPTGMKLLIRELCEDSQIILFPELTPDFDTKIQA